MVSRSRPFVPTLTDLCRIFIIEGCLTIFISFFLFFFVPNFPQNSNILSPSEKEHLLLKLRQDKGDQKLSLKGVNWAKVLTDYKILLP